MDDPLSSPAPARKRAKSAKPVKTHRDLTYVGRRGDIATFGAPSESDPTKTNLVDIDIRTGERHCSCRYCEAHPDNIGHCWLTREVRHAWYAHQYAQLPTARLETLDREYAAARNLTPEDVTRWGLIGEEIAKREERKGGRRRLAVAS